MLSTGPRRRALGALLGAGVGVALVGSSWAAQAQGHLGPIDLEPTSTTTAAPQETTTTTAAPTTTTRPDLIPSPTTTAPPPDSGDPSPTPSDDPAPAAEPSAGDGGTPPPGAGGFPAELQALMNSVARTPANNTKALLAALAPLQQYGLTESEAAVVGFGRFPVAGLASYSHDWWYPRFGPGWRLHQGTDVFAAYGTPVRAPVDGTVKLANGGLGGVSVYVIEPDGTYWYLAHLAAFAEGLAAGQTVTTGQVVGFVGDSGNARGSPPHVHLEIHPGGGGPVDPKPVLDQFIADALALAPQVVEAYAGAATTGTPPADIALPTPAPQPVTAPLPQRAALLWTTAVSPTGGAVHLAELEAARVASTIDWSSRVEVDGLTAFDRRLAQRLASWWVQPLVHPTLAKHLYGASG